ncbi:hypothetical protein ACMGDF_17095 [Morganella morganii]|uniref:hypothetical protein n=1 Tax=Morganella morganii TaxID=582 RepID=UPI003EBAF529
MKILKGNRLMLFDDGKLAIPVRIRRLFSIILRYFCGMKKDVISTLPYPEKCAFFIMTTTVFRAESLIIVVPFQGK